MALGNTEQLPPALAIELAAERFMDELLTGSALVVLWAGAADPEQVVQQFLRAKGWDRLADRRRRLSLEEQGRRDAVEALAEELHKFYLRAKGEQWQPILQDALVKFCVAYETFIKRVAEVFELCPRGASVPDLLLVPESQVAKARNAIRREWKAIPATEPRRFFSEAIEQRNPDPNRYRLTELLETQAIWVTLSCAFELRNDIVHNGGKVSHQIDICGEQLFVGQDAQVSLTMLGAVRSAIQNLAHPFSRYWTM